MAIGDETLIDAPVTPAPIFAYRALRAVFWGEQDTPEQVSRQGQISDDKVAGTSQAQDNTTKPSIQLTPNHKRKHSAFANPSPTKSILRTPGAHTPRRALLKDLNVTFKDLSKSISPELANKQPQTTKGIHVVVEDKENQPPITLGGKTKSKDKATVPVPSTHIAHHEKTKSDPTTTVVPSELRDGVAIDFPDAPILSSTLVSTNTNKANFDADAFVRNTEKEMKKLIKYGQKMREYGRRKDEENIKLRSMLDEMRRENEQLRKQLEISQSKGRIDGDPTRSMAESRTSYADTALKASTRTQSKAKGTKGTGDFDLLDLEDITAPEPRYPIQQRTNSTRVKRTAQNPVPASKSVSDNIVYRDGDEINSSPSKRQRRYDSSHKHGHDTKPSGPTLLQPIPSAPSITAIKSATIPITTTVERSKSHAQHVPLPARLITSQTPTSKLVPDRLAAARARVRMKAEMRRTSAENEVEVEVAGADASKTVSHVRDGACSRTEKEKMQDKNNIESSLSLLDWAAL